MENRQIHTFVLPDPAADRKFNVICVPDDHNYTIEKAYAVADRTIAASTANYVNVSLQNGGTDCAGSTDISTAVVGGTAGWVANTPKEITITSGSGKLTAGQWLTIKYDEEGTVDPGILQVVVELVDGIGSKA